MKKTLLLATSAIVLSAWSARADFSVAPVDMSQWSGKYITLDGHSGVSTANRNNVNRFVFDVADESKLVGQTNYDGAGKYWLVEIDETTGGMLLKNAVTGRYIGTIGQTDESQIPMLAADAAEGRGVFMAYEFEDQGVNYGYVLTTTQVRQGSAAGNPQSGTLMDNPNLSHKGENKGYADFGPNSANANKLWLYCGVSTADVTPVTNYGNPHNCSKWDITAYDSEASILNAHVTDALNARYPSAKEANKTLRQLRL